MERSPSWGERKSGQGPPWGAVVDGRVDGHGGSLTGESPSGIGASGIVLAAGCGALVTIALAALGVVFRDAWANLATDAAAAVDVAGSAVVAEAPLDAVAALGDGGAAPVPPASGWGPDGELVDAWADEQAHIDDRCAGLPRAVEEDLPPGEALLPTGALPPAGLSPTRDSALEGVGLNDVAVLSSGPRDTRLLADMGVTTGWAREYRSTTGWVQLAYFDFESTHMACRFAEFDFLYHPGADLRILPSIPTGWEASDELARHLHFQIDDRVYLFRADVTVDPMLLEGIAVAHVDALGES